MSFPTLPGKMSEFQGIFPQDESFQRVFRSAKEAVYVDILRRPLPGSFELVASSRSIQEEDRDNPRVHSSHQGSQSDKNNSGLYTLSRLVKEEKMERDTARKLIDFISNRLGIEVRNESGGYEIPVKAVEIIREAKRLYWENPGKFVSLTHAAEFVIDQMENPFTFSGERGLDQEKKIRFEKIARDFRELEKRLASLSALGALVSKIFEEFESLSFQLFQLAEELGVDIGEAPNNHQPSGAHRKTKP